MDLVCLKNDLVFGVRLASHALGTRSSMPILAGLKLEIEGNQLRMLATDLERAVRCEIPLKENKGGNGSIVLNGSVFNQIAAHLPSDDYITLTSKTDDGTSIQLPVIILPLVETVGIHPSAPVVSISTIPAPGLTTNSSISRSSVAANIRGIRS